MVQVHPLELYGGSSSIGRASPCGGETENIEIVAGSYPVFHPHDTLNLFLNMDNLNQKQLEKFVRKNFEVVEKLGEYERRVYCPFCGGYSETAPGGREFSFDIRVDPKKPVFNCNRKRKCGKTGSIVELVAYMYDIDYEDAKSLLEKEDVSDEQSLRKRIKSASASIDLKYNNHQDVHEFSKDKVDIFPNNIVKFCNAPFDKKQEIKWWIEKERGYDTDKFFNQHNIYVPINNNESYRDKFEHRVIIEVFSQDSRAYLAYSYREDVQPKTLNPPGQVLSQMLYNYNSAVDANYIFIVEGFFDAARLKSWGYHPLAIFGTNISYPQIHLLEKTSAKEICVCLDEGVEKESKKVVRDIGTYIHDKKLTFMKIEKEGADPDDLCEDEFVNYFSKRKRYLNNDSDKIKEKLNKLED